MAGAMLVGSLLALSAPPSASQTSPLHRDHFKNYSSADGLGHSRVNAILQDRDGFLWFATQNGLSRFDGYEFKTWEHEANNPESLGSSYLDALAEDDDGSLWIGTHRSGLDRFDRSSQSFEHFRHDPSSSQSLASDAISDLLVDRHGTLWTGTAGGGLCRLHRQTPTFTCYDTPDRNAETPWPNWISKIFEDSQGELWLGTTDGIGRFDRQKNRIVAHRLATPEGPRPQIITAIQERSDGQLWVGTTAGLYRLSADRQEIVFYQSDPLDPQSDSSRAALDLYLDVEETLWIGTDAGVLEIGPTADHRVLHAHRPADPHSLGGNLAMKLAGDRDHGLWVSTGSGVSRFDRRLRQFQHYQHDPNDPRSQGPGRVVAAHEDREGRVWIATHDGLSRLDDDRRTAKRYVHDIDDPSSLSYNLVWEIHEDARGVLWIGTEVGLDRYDRDRDAFTHYRHDPTDPTSLSPGRVLALHGDRAGNLWIGANYTLVRRLPDGRFEAFPNAPAHNASDQPLMAIHEDLQGDLWIATDGGGLSRRDPATGRFFRYRHDPLDPTSLSHDQVSTLYEDQQGTLWIGTIGGGVNALDAGRRRFRHYRLADGLPSDAICGIEGDARGTLWISTDRGLAHLDPDSGEIKIYDVDDGALTAFSTRAHFGSKRGELFFGGRAGLIAFLPGKITAARDSPPVFLTDFLLENQPVLGFKIGSNEEIVLPYGDDFFAFEFTALEYSNPARIEYAFMLEGFNASWIPTTADRRFAQFSKIAPGEYTFRARARSRDSHWNESSAIDLRVLPPWWRTWWAWSIYTLTAAAVVLGFVRSQKKKVVFEREINARLRRVDQLKNEFLANTSHELRTPLHGMIGLAESLLEGASGDLTPAARENLVMIAGSGQRLRHLVDDILDFSKLRHKSLELRRRAIDPQSLVDVVLALLQPLATSKHLSMVNAVSPQTPKILADENRLQQILLNLVGNAIKFTDEGEVTVSATATRDTVEICVCDTGIGIAEDDQLRIFESFEQVDASAARAASGTGLGLALTRQLIEIQGGRLWVESVLGKGSTFFFTMPLAGDEQSGIVDLDHDLLDLDSEASSAVTAVSAEDVVAMPATLFSTENGNRQRILIVDDEPVNRRVLQHQLTLESYEVVEAASGREALVHLDSGAIDLVLLDVMMPAMTGFAVCREIRRQYPPQELPVIFLTALSRTEDLLQGLGAGGNDYLAKPISKAELLARVKLHLDLLQIHRHLEQLVEQRTAQLKILRGLLPICIGCKKIRDDQGYWSEVAMYLSTHTEAEFSHGMCPDCFTRHYPDFAEPAPEDAEPYPR